VARTALVTAAVLYALSAISSALVLPDRVPLHFGADGAADRYGSRAEAGIGFAALGLGMLVLWLVVLQCLRRSSLDLFNVPHPAPALVPGQRSARCRWHRALRRAGGGG